VLIQGSQTEVLLARREIPLDAFGERCSGRGVRPDWRHQRRTQGFRAPQVGGLGALARNDITIRRAAINPDWTVAIHPETALVARYTAFVDGAVPEVPLENEAFYGLGHPSSVRVLVQSVK
jgi:hypothetical protein